jgi:hypothetical protein
MINIITVINAIGFFIVIFGVLFLIGMGFTHVLIWLDE